MAERIQTPHPMSQEDRIDPATGMNVGTRTVYGTYDPTAKAWGPIKLPTIQNQAVPSSNHLNALRAQPQNAAVAAQFDAKYGPGAAKRALGN